MHAIWVVSVTVHVLAAVIWAGGMAAFALVLLPWLRTESASRRAAVVAETGRRLRVIGWWCLPVLAVTGVINLAARGWTWERLGDPAWLMAPANRLILVKLGVFVLIVGLSAWHDFVVGPRARDAMLAAPGSASAEAARARAGRLGRLNALLAVVAIALGVMIVRGSPL